MKRPIDYRADIGKSFVIAKDVQPCAYCGAPFIQFLSGAYGEPMGVSLRHPAAGLCALVDHTFPYDAETIGLLNQRPGNLYKRPVIEMDKENI